MKFYSQSGEDFLLHSVLGRQEDGFYIDIGAFDGVHLSNSFVFEKLGWSGICVEPHPEYYPHLCRARPNAVCVNTAIVGHRQADSTIFKKEPLGLLSGITADKTPNMEHRYARRNMNFEGFDEVEVPCLTLNELMEHHAPGRRRIGFLSIDTEGTEADILETFSFELYQVQIVVVEANDEAARRTMETLMRSRGYKFARQIGCNLVFARRADDAGFLAYKKIDCEIEDTLHPMGEGATLSINRARRIGDDRFQAAPNVLCQHPNQPLSSLIEFFPNPFRQARGLATRFVHAVNLFPSLGGEQARVAATLRAAKEEDERAIIATGAASGEVILVNVQSGGDPDQTPEGFVRAGDLDRDVRNLATFRHPRSLPLLFDILDRLVEQAGPNDYVVYSNADICLQPHFYRNLRELVSFGFDAITINRRTIGAQSGFPSSDSPLALAEAGMLHGGFDCFVFHVSLYESFVKNNACLGTARVMRGLLHNLVAHAAHMLMLRNVALTYHYGNDVLWNADRYEDQASFNLNECVQTLTQLCEEPARRSRLAAFCDGHPEAAVFRRIAKGEGEE